MPPAKGPFASFNFRSTVFVTPTSDYIWTRRPSIDNVALELSTNLVKLDCSNKFSLSSWTEGVLVLLGIPSTYCFSYNLGYNLIRSFDSSSTSVEFLLLTGISLLRSSCSKVAKEKRLMNEGLFTQKKQDFMKFFVLFLNERFFCSRIQAEHFNEEKLYTLKYTLIQRQRRLMNEALFTQKKDFLEILCFSSERTIL